MRNPSDTSVHPKRIDLSIVIPAYNAAGTIEAQLRALANQTWEGSWEIIVADNGSTDRTRAIVTDFAASDPRVRIVDASGARGPSFARNQGAANARGSLLAFCDADDEVADGWMSAMALGISEWGFVTGPQDTARLNPATHQGLYGTGSSREMQRFAGIFPYGPAANLGVSATLLERLGGFDETLTTGEDLELCLRAWQGGLELRFVPTAVVHYRYRRSTREIFEQAVTYGRAAPMIAGRLAAGSLPVPPRFLGAKSWWWLIRRLPSLRTRQARLRWLVVLGTSLGRLTGSLRAGRLML